MKHNRNEQPPVSERIHESEINMRETLPERLKEWRLGFSIAWDTIFKAVVCVLLVVFTALLQTTIFTRFRIADVVPDFMISLIIAVAMADREKWGAVVGLLSAVVIESIGGGHVFVLPVFYVLTGYLCGILTTNYFRSSLLVRLVYTAAASFIRSLITIGTLLVMTEGQTGLGTIIIQSALPEFLVSILLSFIPHLYTVLALKPFEEHRKKAENRQYTV